MTMASPCFSRFSGRLSRLAPPTSVHWNLTHKLTMLDRCANKTGFCQGLSGAVSRHSANQSALLIGFIQFSFGLGSCGHVATCIVGLISISRLS